MRIYRVSDIYHKVYEDTSELPDGLVVVHNWRKAQIGDWVEADDNCILQILRKGKMKTPRGKAKFREYVGTCAGTFICSPKVKMDSSKRDNIWTISGKDTERVILDRRDLTKCEILFVQYMAGGLDPKHAYLTAFKTDNPLYAKEQSTKLVKTERIQTAMKEELKPVLAELGVDEKYILERLKAVIEGTEKDDTRLKALFKLSDIMDLEDKTQTKVTQLTGAVFKGFTSDLIGDVERPEELGE